MKKQHKGLFFVVLFGGGLLFWATAASITGVEPVTQWIPADNYSADLHGSHCGTGVAKSTDFVREYSIPTSCTNPLAVATDYDGNVWFTQTNLGGVTKFDPSTETFTEYANPLWPRGNQSMMWGIDYSPDGLVWFTDEVFDSIWMFSTIDEQYDRLQYPSQGNSLPQRLLVDGSQIIINDFTGNKITFLRDPTNSDQVASHVTLPSPIDGFLTGGFAVDADDNIWYTNWSFQQGGVLVRFDQPGYEDAAVMVDDQLLPLGDHVEIFTLPAEMLTPNGVAVGHDGLVWIADTTSSSFFSFDPFTEEFTQYVTAAPVPAAYGNQSGIIKSPISGPYWVDTDDRGRIVFNAQAANTIGVMDPRSQSLVEYQVPSRNPHWTDCDPGTGLMVADCGIAQVLNFAVDGDMIWFTEWVENNIGVVDTSLPLPVDVRTDSELLSISAGETGTVSLQVSPKTDSPIGASVILSSTHDFLMADLSGDSPEVFQLSPGQPRTVGIEITAADDAVPGTYKVLAGVQTTDVAVGKFITVTVQ